MPRPKPTNPDMDAELVTRPTNTNANKFTPAQREQVSARIAASYLKGEPLAKIARELCISYATAMHYLKRLERQWREAAIVDFDRARSIELQKLTNLESTYWDAWERSQEEAKKVERVIAPKGLDENGNPILQQKSQKVKTEDQIGDPRYLDGVFRCIDRRIKLLGLDEAERHTIEVTDANNALSARLQKYAHLFGAEIIDIAPANSYHNSLGESLDSERSASEASGIPDTHQLAG